MKNFRVEILPIAQNDVIAALDYIAVDLANPAAALKLYSTVADCFSLLKDTPYCGRELETDIPLKYKYRWVLAENYMIFYTVDEVAETVYIMRMLFGSSDYVSILK
ncbi:MAG: type II toxin-antitoxin system RelE/ParE family toxin [Clostridiales bacterium]|nr:type II toxin-antitoxin system RelE/ParE family toxin [Clostridiales bacterium]